MTVLAAGGVVWRHAEGTIEVLLIHRPDRGDWSLPKGKVDRWDIDLEATARREVLEETGHRCVAGDQLLTVQYVDRRGRLKRVTYWEMQALEARFRPNREADAIAWATLDRARAELRERDASVLDAFARWHALTPTALAP